MEGSYEVSSPWKHFVDKTQNHNGLLCLTGKERGGEEERERGESEDRRRDRTGGEGEREDRRRGREERRRDRTQGERERERE
jgi:hypothetical protein